MTAEGVDEILNIRMDDGLTLTLEDNATLSCDFLTGNANEEINVVLSDNAMLTTERIVRTALEISGDANLLFVRAAVITQTMPVADTNRINLSGTWTGCIETEVPNGNRTLFIIPDNPGVFTGLFNSATIDGVEAINVNFRSILFGASVFHTLPLLGDVDENELVSFADVSPFIALLSSSGFQREADINRSGTVDFADVSPFIAILSGQ